MVKHDCGEIPAVESRDNPRLVGAVTDRDITCRTIALGKNPLKMTAEDCMTAPCVTVTPNASIEECCKIMDENRVRRVPVVDDAGCCCGIVAQADIAKSANPVDLVEVLERVSEPTKKA